MKQKQLRFTVDDRRSGPVPSRWWRTAGTIWWREFVFSGDWEGLEKTAVFEQASGWSIMSWCRTEPVPYRRR